MGQTIYYGQTLKDAFKSAERLLEQRVDELNALNVFPVPDGDTGINMFLTMQAAIDGLEDLNTNSAAEIAAKIARGALLGARGNSGVLLSQIFRGMAKGLGTKEYFTPADFAQALNNASETAYLATSKPVEGTILTVIRESAQAASKSAEKNGNLRQIITAVTNQARMTVKKTPELLPELREAGVVDAGGKGLFYVFLGMKQSLSEKTQPAGEYSQKETANPERKNGSYGIDLQFLLEGENLNPDEIRGKIEQMGDSVLVAGDERISRVHIHTQDPQAVIDYCKTRGEVKDIIKEDMDKQVARLKTSRAER